MDGGGATYEEHCGVSCLVRYTHTDVSEAWPPSFVPSPTHSLNLLSEAHVHCLPSMEVVINVLI